MIEFKLKQLTRHNKYLMTAMQLLLPVWIYLAWGSDWYWWVLTLVFYFLYVGVGNNVGLHRYYSHRNFEMSKPVEYFVLWCTVMTCLGSPVSYAGVHLIHHKFSDQPNDPHGPTRGWKSILYLFHRQLGPQDIIPSRYLAELIVRFKWLHDYYWLAVLINALLIYIIFGWTVLLFAWLIPASLCLWIIALVLLQQHDSEGATNTKIYTIYGCGEGWHKNHHYNPGKPNNADPGCVDWTYRLCRLFAKRID